MNKFVRHLLLSALVLVTVMVGGTLAYASNTVNTNVVRGVPMSQPIPQIASVDAEWDRSSVSVTGACVDGVPTFYVSNTGEAGGGDMDAPTTWRLVDADGNILTSGTIQVAGGDTQTLSFPEYAGQTVRLYVDQRPGHPGNSNPNHVIENCGVAPTPTEEPTEVVTEEPTEEPTEVVTEEPTEEPTEVVTEEPTEEPTEVVTEEPTQEPTPDVTPTEEPTVVPAVFDAYIECNYYGGITYTVYLVEGEMSNIEYYSVYYTNMDGWGVNIGFVEWLNDYNTSISFEVYDVSATTFWVEGLDHLTRSISCSSSDTPELSVGTECYYDAPTFYIYNIGNGDMTSETEWYLYDSSGNWLTSGFVYLASGDTQVLSFPEYAELELTMYVQQPFEYSGDSYAVASIFPCVEPVTVELESSIECNAYGGITFTVSIIQGEMNYGEYYPVYYTNADGWDILVGFVEWLSSDYYPSVSFEVYDVTSTTFWVDGYGSLNLSIDCGAPTEEPTEIVTEEPTEEPTPVVTPTEEPTEEPTPVVTPTEEPTEEPTPVVTPTPEPTPTDEVWDKSSVEVTGECLNGIPTFYVTNTGEEGMTGETTWRLTDVSTGEIIASGTIILGGFETQWLQFPEYADRILRLNVDQRPGHPGNSNPNAVVGTCYVPTPEPTPEPEPVDFVTSAVCANNGTITFTVTYTGTGAMAQGESYTVRYTTDDLTDENAVFVTLGTVSRLSQSRPTATFTVRRMSGQTVTFVVDGMPILTTTVDCWDKSSVSVSGQCVNGVPVFNVNNTGTEGMTGDTEWRLVDVQTGAILTSGTIRLGGNETQQLSFPEYASLNIRLYVDQRPGHPGSSQPTDSLNNCANS